MMTRPHFLIFVLFSPAICNRSTYETDGYKSTYRIYLPNGNELRTHTFSLNGTRYDDDIQDKRSKLYIMGLVPVDADFTKGSNIKCNNQI